MKKEAIELGMVFSCDEKRELEYVVTGIYPDSVTLERITQRSESNNRHGVGYGWFEDYYRLRRKMGKKKLDRYLTHDPACNCEPGLYKTTKEIVDIDFRTLASCKEIVKVTKVDCDKLISSNRHELTVTFLRFGIEGDFLFREANSSKNGCIHRFWQLFERIY
jgi:hypothetical protein